ncbi:hypothetical protein DKL51_24995 [Micromonospora globispora]|nr:hypothetical protein DKL51_24995 [Micromonospora globispora]
MASAARAVAPPGAGAFAAHGAAGAAGAAGPGGPVRGQTHDTARLLCCSGGNTERPVSGQSLLRGGQQSKGGG